MTSVPFSHATPAGFVAHSPDRDDYHAIARQMLLTSAADVVMGAGNPGFTDAGTAREKPEYEYIDEPTWTAVLSGRPCADADGDGSGDAWTVVQSRADFTALARVPRRNASSASRRSHRRSRRRVRATPSLRRTRLPRTNPSRRFRLWSRGP